LQINLFNQLKSFPAASRRTAEPIQDAVNQLVDEVYLLCMRLTPLESYLVTSTTRSSIRGEMEMNKLKMENITDEVLRQEYEEIQQTLDNRLEKLESVANQLSRSEAELINVANEIEGYIVDILRLGSMNPDQAKERSDIILIAIQKSINEVSKMDNSSQSVSE
jgi:hypothetical protein